MEPTSATIDANINQCIKVIENFGNNTYMNICTGADPVVVPWGSIQWTAAIVIPTFFIAFVAFLIYAVSRR